MGVMRFTGKVTGKVVAGTKAAPSNTKNRVSSWKHNFQEGYLDAVYNEKKGNSVLDTDLPV
jgi:hypothetical protein